jgi:alcohol dehydrogenase class IV
MPRAVTIDTGIDAFVHGFESYLSAGCSVLTDILSLETMKLSHDNLPVAVFAPENIKAREAMANAATLGGMACTNAGLGAVHALTYPLTKYGLSHGRSNAVMLPHVTAYNLPVAYRRYAEVGKAVFGADPDLPDREAAIELVELIKTFLDDLGVPYRLRDYGIAGDQIDRMSEVAFNSGKHLLPTNPRKLFLEDVCQIYRTAW